MCVKYIHMVPRSHRSAFQYKLKKIITVMINYRNRHPWMTDVLRTLIKEKIHCTLSQKLQTTHTFYDYNIKKNLLKSSLINAEIKYFSDQLDLHKDNLSNSWRVLKTIIGKNSNTSAQRLSLYVNDKTITDSTDVANKLYNLFVSIGPRKNHIY